MVALAAFSLMSLGCVQRRILIRSNPEGALVTVDRQPIGHTPVAFPFTYYGTRIIELEKDGYQSVQVKHRFRPPWYQIPPLDFIADNFWPREIRDDRLLEFPMKPLETVNEGQLLDRANQLRGDVYRNTIAIPLAKEDADESVKSASQSPLVPIRSR